MRENTLFLAVGSVVIIGLFLLLNTMVSTYEIFVYPEWAIAATSSAVTVSASVQATIACSTDEGSTDFGTWTDTSIKTATPNASSTMSCANSGSGCTLYVKDAGDGNPGLYNSGATYLIASASTTLSGGTEGYGIQATSTATGSGGAITINSTYYKESNDVGGLLTTNAILASTIATSSNREVVVTHKASVASNTPSGSYTDTLTYECTAN
ncbi:MAG: hypothetical protein ABIH10_01870 [Spirochaetota bacterium]